MKNMQVLLYVLFIVLCANAHSQPSIENYTSEKGELIFIKGSLPEAVLPIVRVDAAGLIFNSTGEYDEFVASGHPERNYYGQISNYHNSLHGYTAYLTADPIWESAYYDEDDDDEPAESNQCVGMIGWGDYRVSIRVDSDSIEFYLSTLDGNWMSTPDTVGNKLFFYVNTTRESVQDPVEYEVFVYDWYNDEWKPVYDGDKVNWWAIRGMSRNRDQISGMDKMFSTPMNGNIVPYFTDVATLDVNLRVKSKILVSSGKTLYIRDFYDENDDSWKNTYVDFEDSDGKVLVKNGILKVHSCNEAIADDQYAVYFRSIYAAHDQDRYPWSGIEIINGMTAQYRYELHHASIENAKCGLKAERVWGGIWNTALDSCKSGIEATNAITSISECSIKGTGGNGISIHGLSDTIYAGGYIYTTIFDTQVEGSFNNGIYIQSNKESYSGGYSPLWIDGCEIKRNYNNGIYLYYGAASVSNSVLSLNGMRWASVPPVNPRPNAGSGFEIENSVINVYYNEIVSNARYGILLLESQLISSLGMPNNVHEEGNNCFYNNYINIFAGTGGRQQNSLILFDSPGSSQTYNLTGFINPRYYVNNDGNVEYVQADLEYATAWFSGNYLSPNSTILHAYDVLVENPLSSPSATHCNYGSSGDVGDGSTSSSGSTETSKSIVKLVAAALYQEAMDTCIATSTFSLNRNESAVYAGALARCFYSGGIEAAKDSLLSWANAGYEGDCPPYLRVMAMSELRDIYFVQYNSEMVEYYNQELLDDLCSSSLTEDTLALRINEALKLLIIEQDTTSSKRILDSLYLMFPTNKVIENQLFNITGDTTILDYTLSKLVTRNAPTEEITTIKIGNPYPNPSSSEIQIPIDIAKGKHIVLAIYDNNGVLKNKLYDGYVGEGRRLFSFDVRSYISGLYYIVMEAADEKISKKVTVLR
jgi:hypothetical protein